MDFSTVSVFRKNLSAKQLFPIYLLAGEETFLINDSLKRIEKIVKTDDLNREVFQATECSGNDILNSVETLPFLTDKRLVILKSADKLKTDDAKIITKIVENLIDACEDSNNCFCVDCKKQYEKDVRNFIQEDFSNRAIQADYDVVMQIINDAGLDLQNVSGEIEKISLYLGRDKKKLTMEDFIKISGYTKEINSFMLTNSIEERNLKNSLFISEKMLQTGESGIMLLSAISTAVRKLITVKSLMEEKNYSSKDALNFVKVHTYYHNKYLTNLNKYSFVHLKKCLKEVLKTDVAIKTGKLDEKSAIENLVLFICK